MISFSAGKFPYSNFNIYRANDGNYEGYNRDVDRDEAIEDQDIHDEIYEDRLNNSEDEVSGEDMMENMDRDYEKRSELDNYEAAGIDDENQIELDMNARQDVERRLDQEERLRQNMQGRRRPVGFDDELEDDDEEMHRELRQERMRMMVRNDMGDGNNSDDGENYQNILDFEDVKGPLSIWLKKDDVIKFIHRQFNQFLRNFRDEEGKFVYEEKIHTMCQNNKQSLEVVFNQLSSRYPTLAIWLAEEPALMLPILNTVAEELVSEVYPDYHKIHENIFVRVRDLPVEDKLRDLRQVHLNALIKIKGVVTKRTGVFPEEQKSYYRCLGCQDIKGPYINNKREEAK